MNAADLSDDSCLYESRDPFETKEFGNRDVITKLGDARICTPSHLTRRMSHEHVTADPLSTRVLDNSVHDICTHQHIEVRTVARWQMLLQHNRHDSSQTAKTMYGPQHGLAAQMH
jgi:hypothetical protein